MIPASRDKHVDHTRSRQQAVVVDPTEAGTGTHHGKAVAAAAAVVVAAVVDGYRVDILMGQQVVDGHLLVLVAVDGGNKVVFEGGVGWGYWWVRVGKMSFEVVQVKGNCKCLNFYYPEN
ncbi:hypothetical protein Tco_0374926 [Tanacetum coccineum]